MRLNMQVSDLTPFQWQRLQELVQVGYDFRPGDTRACVVFTSSTGEERHAEMPFSAYVAVNSALELFAIAEAMPRPEGLAEDVRLVDVSASNFEGAPPVRTYSDGSMALGPYRNVKTVDRSDEIKG